MAAAGIASVAFIVSRTPYQLDRVRALFDPWVDPLGIGFHTIQGLLALGLGGILGAGLGESRLAGGLFLPNASNDFIFAIIGEEFGLIGGALVVILFLVIALPGHADGPGGARHVRGAARGGDHDLAVRPGVHQHRRGGGDPADHRHHAALHLGRRVVADHQLRGRRYPPVDFARDRRTRDVERCGC